MACRIAGQVLTCHGAFWEEISYRLACTAVVLGVAAGLAYNLGKADLDLV